MGDKARCVRMIINVLLMPWVAAAIMILIVIVFGLDELNNRIKYGKKEYNRCVRKW
jgi:hypothetical protein